ncbi:MAG: radical SAM protein [Anaerolineae bacterium]|nr:radical SAM protein [Anaerolineae bacterium]
MDINGLTFGPVPSRRLGRSLGINNIPPKICTYSCVYCQVGRTYQMQVERQAFYSPELLFQAVQAQIDKASKTGEKIDYLTFVPDGEPTLDVNLGHSITKLKSLDIPIAVITNNSLIWHEEVRAALARADWVSLKVDAAEEEIWRRIDRPHRSLKLARILEGALAFAQTYRGKLVTETMLVDGINDGEAHIHPTADVIGALRPDVAYLAIPTRPPAEPQIRPANEISLNRAYQIFCERMGTSPDPVPVEYLIGYEGNTFAFTGDAAGDLLSVTAVHPMRQDAVQSLLARAGADWKVVDALIAQGQMVSVAYEGQTFYVRKFR